MVEKKSLGYGISYLAAVVILLVIYAVKQTPVALFGAILCAGLGVKYLLDYRRLKKRK
ncbi:MAG: hypothetical protein VB055_08355 [Oscillospiraceae bacterium]|nr:hypothetical protein [Oscillospiraceae bacterium]